jgi:VWFA-related protein
MKIAVSIFFAAALLTPAAAQTPESQAITIKVGVEEVRIDAVVLDKKGQQVTDLTAGEFEVYQDGKLQKIISCAYINHSRTQEKAIVSPEAARAEQLISKPKPLKENVQRTIVFMVSSSGADPRPHLQNFIESHMEHGDLVGFLGAGPTTLSSDKRELLARIKDIRAPRGGFSGVDAAIGTPQSSQLARPLFAPLDEDVIRMLKAEIAPIRYAIRALRDLPGRKYLILTQPDIFSGGSALWVVQNRLINEVADEAWRAGVVISTWEYYHTWNANGRFNPLFKKTGGLYTDSYKDFLYKGKPALDAMNGYYLLSYIPPEKTFNNKKQDKYNRIGVYVKRKGMKVLSRDGFLASAGSSDFAAASSTNNLQQAMYSPILSNDLKLNLSSGYAYTPASGYFLRSWMHLDGKDLTFTKKTDASYSISLEMLSSTSDSSGRTQGTKNLQYNFTVTDPEIQQIRKEGVDLKSYLPVQNPGNYYVSAAIRDKASGKIGTGYQFVDIPDLGRSGLSLSSIFLINSIKDVSEIKSGNIRAEVDSFNAMRHWEPIDRSPALRTYKPDDDFDYLVVVYNAQDQDNPTPELEFQSTLFKDGKIHSQDPPRAISLNEMDDMGRIPILKMLVFDRKIEEGDYILQLTVKDKPAEEKSRSKLKPRVAVQAIDFQIRKE